MLVYLMYYYKIIIMIIVCDLSSNNYLVRNILTVFSPSRITKGFRYRVFTIHIFFTKLMEIPMTTSKKYHKKK